MGEELGQVVCEPENADGDVEAGDGPYGERTLDVTPPGVNWGGSRCGWPRSTLNTNRLSLRQLYPLIAPAGNVRGAAGVQRAMEVLVYGHIIEPRQWCEI